eukprot:2871519-Prymnesium_polylepis.1
MVRHTSWSSARRPCSGAPSARAASTAKESKKPSQNAEDRGPDELAKLATSFGTSSSLSALSCLCGSE